MSEPSIKSTKGGDGELEVRTTDRRQAKITQPEQEPELAIAQQQVHALVCDDALSVLSPLDSNFDFLPMNSTAKMMPWPHRRGFASSPLDIKVARSSNPLSLSRDSSGASFPATFFKSPLGKVAEAFGNRHQAVKTPMKSLRVTTSQQAHETNDLIILETKKKPVSSNEKDAVASRKAATVPTPPRSLSSLWKQQLNGRQSKNGFECTDADEGRSSARDAIKSPVGNDKQVQTRASPLDPNDIQSGPLTSPSEHDTFFSFVNSLSPLLPLDEIENAFMSVKSSPLVPLSSYDVPRLRPPSIDEEHQVPAISTGVNDGISLIHETFSKKALHFRHILSAAGDGTSTPGSANKTASSKQFTDSFPNIQASTSATPGKDERLKLRNHSLIKMKLHASFAASSSLQDSHSTRDFQAMNNSLKRKQYNCRRKAEKKRLISSSVQRKLLQTPEKTTELPRTTRSPLQPWNGQSHDAHQFQTTTLRKRKQSQQSAAQRGPHTPRSLPVVRRTSPATEPNLPMTTPANTKKKRKAAQFVSMPSPKINRSANIKQESSLAVQQAMALVTTPVRQLKRRVTTTASTTSALSLPSTGNQSDMSTFNDRLAQTPIPVAISTAMQLSLQPVSKAQLSSADMVISAKEPKKAPCNCKKSKCLKLYCECFASGGYCDGSCNCLNCANTPTTGDLRQQAIASRLERNPNAFKPKIGATPTITPAPANGRRLSVLKSVRSCGSPSVLLSTPGHLTHQQQQSLSASIVATKMHKHGCHCKKSACQKKYCECFQAGVPCGGNCRCIECKNQAPIGYQANDEIAAVAIGTSSLSNELEETFVSPVLRGFRKRMRIDRESYNQSVPFEASPGCSELLRSRHLSSKRGSSSGDASVRSQVNSMPFAAPTTPRTRLQNGLKRSRKLSVIRGNGEIQRETSTSGAQNLLLLKKRKACNDKASNVVEKAALSAAVPVTSVAKRIFVLPLFGARLVPVESDVSAKIFGFLTNADLHNASLVSCLWNQVALGDTVWDHANFIPTEVNAAETLQEKPPIKLEPRIVVDSNTRTRMVAIERDSNFAVLSTLR